MPTEKEARTRWCPFARLSTSYFDGDPLGAGVERRSGGSFNRVNRANPGHPVPLLGPCMCIASDCMAWQWENQETQTTDIPRNHPSWEYRKGYCGLARR